MDVHPTRPDRAALRHGGRHGGEGDCWPTFLVIGAAKSGTTALHHYLAQHPDVFVPSRQEPSFFSFEDQPPQFTGANGTPAAINSFAISDVDEYRDLFREGVGRRARGEVSTVYLYWPGTAERIRQHLPEVRLCAVLRNPADRAYSAFMHARRDGREPLRSFAEALAAEADRVRDNWGPLWRYADLGFYWHQLRRFYDVFPAEQIRVFLYEDLLSAPERVCSELYDFIGVDPEWTPDVSLRHNVSGLPRSRAVQAVIKGASPVARAARAFAPMVGETRMRRWQTRISNANVKKIPMPAVERRLLQSRFEQDLGRLGSMIGRDLSHWSME